MLGSEACLDHEKLEDFNLLVSAGDVVSFRCETVAFTKLIRELVHVHLGGSSCGCSFGGSSEPEALRGSGGGCRSTHQLILLHVGQTITHTIYRIFKNTNFSKRYLFHILNIYANFISFLKIFSSFIKN